MKILVVGQRWNDYNEKTFRGGAEKSEYEYLKALSIKNENEIHFLTNKKSMDCSFSNVTTHKLLPSKLTEEGESLGKKYMRQRSEMIKNKIDETKPDLIMCHDDINGSVTNVIVASGIPSMTFIHSVAEFVGGFNIFGFLENMQKLIVNGHKLIFVSESSRTGWIQTFIKQQKYLSFQFNEKILLDNSTVFPPIMYWKKEPLLETKNEYIMISRFSKQKNVKVGLSVHSGNLDFYSSTPLGDHQKEQYDEVMKMKQSNRIHLDVPYEELMKRLNQSKALVMFGEESFGIVVFEANSFGVPVIIHNKMNDSHPSKMVGSNVKIVPWSKDHLNYKECIENFIAPTMQERIETQNSLWNMYGYDIILQKLESYMKSIKMNFVVRKSINLEHLM